MVLLLENYLQSSCAQVRLQDAIVTSKLKVGSLVHIASMFESHVNHFYQIIITLFYIFYTYFIFLHFNYFTGLLILYTTAVHSCFLSCI